MSRTRKQKILDATNGELAGALCPLVVLEVLLEGTQPGQCDGHSAIMAPLIDWWKAERQVRASM